MAFRDPWGCSKNPSVYAVDGTTKTLVASNCATDGSTVKGVATVGESGKLQLTFNSEDKAINLCYIIIKANGEGAALPQTGIKGDVNIDGKVSSADLVALEKYLVNAEMLSRDQWLNGDINRDDSVDSFDFVMLRQLVIKSAS